MVNFAHPAGRARAAAPAAAAAAGAEPRTLRGFFGVFRYSRRALELVWRTSPGLTLALGVLTLIAGVVPAGVAYIGSLIVDAVVAAVKHPGGSVSHVFELVLLEGALVASTAAAQRGISLCQSLLRAQLGQRVNVMILEKALTLELQHFEDSEFYDKLTRARREASSRPLSLVMRTFGLAQNGISLVSYGRSSCASRRGRLRCCCWRDFRRSSRRPNSPATHSACFAGARPRRACRPTLRPCWRARITPKK